MNDLYENSLKNDYKVNNYNYYSIIHYSFYSVNTFPNVHVMLTNEFDTNSLFFNNDDSFSFDFVNFYEAKNEA
jgi:hypothetical protein